MILTKAIKRTRFKNLKPGLFLHGDMLCAKTEYKSQSPTDGKYYSDAFICSTGEFWWGNVGNFSERDNLLVYGMIQRD